MGNLDRKMPPRSIYQFLDGNQWEVAVWKGFPPEGETLTDNWAQYSVRQARRTPHWTFLG